MTLLLWFFLDFLVFGFWILEAKNKDPILLASKIQKLKKHLFRCFFLVFAKSKNQKKP
jgi:hypothetical protein